MGDETTTSFPIVGSDGKQLFRIEVEARETADAREQVSVLGSGFSEAELKGAIETVARVVGDVLAKVAPTKATAEFGIELGIESGQLTALIVKGSGKANLKIALEWSAAHPAAKS